MDTLWMMPEPRWPEPQHQTSVLVLQPESLSFRGLPIVFDQEFPVTSRVALLEQMERTWREVCKDSFRVTLPDSPLQPIQIHAGEKAQPMWKCERPWARRRKA